MDPDLTVKQLAHMAQLSTWRFTPIFQELTGKKPLHYVTDLRINRAKELLLRRNEPLRSIAQEVGYTDEYYFSRRFRQITGMSAYRQGCTTHVVFSRRKPVRTVLSDGMGYLCMPHSSINTFPLIGMHRLHTAHRLWLPDNTSPVRHKDVRIARCNPGTWPDVPPDRLYTTTRKDKDISPCNR